MEPLEASRALEGPWRFRAFRLSGFHPVIVRNHPANYEGPPVGFVGRNDTPMNVDPIGHCQAKRSSRVVHPIDTCRPKLNREGCFRVDPIGACRTKLGPFEVDRIGHCRAKRGRGIDSSVTCRGKRGPKKAPGSILSMPCSCKPKLSNNNLPASSGFFLAKRQTKNCRNT